MCVCVCVLVTQSCPTLCDAMNRSTPGFPVHHQLLKSTQTHVHWVSDAIQPLISVVPFSSCPQSFPASRSFQMSQLFASGVQSIGVSASASVLPMNTQDWSPLGWTGWISLQSKGLSRVFSPDGQHQNLIIFFAAKDGEALYSQQKQDQKLTVAQIMNSLLPNADWNWRKWEKPLDHSGLQFMRSPRVGHDSAAELSWTELNWTERGVMLSAALPIWLFGAESFFFFFPEREHLPVETAVRMRARSTAKIRDVCACTASGGRPPHLKGGSTCGYVLA